MKKLDFAQTVGLFANIGVILGIIFLGYELRQNTNVARSSAMQAIAQLSYEHNIRVATDPSLRMLQDTLDEEGAAALSPAQRRQAFAAFAALIVLQQNRFEQMKLGILDEATALDIGAGSAYRRPLFAEFWVERKDRYPIDFQNYLEQIAPALKTSMP